MTLNTSGTGVKQPNLVFYGGMGAGKSTAAEFVEREYGYTRLSFATILKQVAVLLWGDDAFSDRGKLQDLGKSLRDIDEDVWVNAALRDLDERQLVQELPVVNDDCRFPNEYWRLKERGFYFVRVLCKEEVRVDRLLRINKIDGPEQLNHVSETALVGLDATREGIVDDFTIFNEGDRDQLVDQINGVLYHIEEGS